MPKETEIPYLRLVAEDTATEEKRGMGVQTTLFAFDHPSLLGFLNTASITAGFLLSLIERVRPRWVFDLRTVPRFNLRGGNRKQVFERFMRHRVEYRDLAAMLGISSRRDASLNSGRVAGVCNAILEDFAEDCFLGPVFFLLDDADELALSTQRLPKSLKGPKDGWEVHVFDQNDPVYGT